MVVVYYTSVAYLDIALEIVHAVKNAVELHVLIEIAPESKGTNILQVGSLDALPVLASPEQVLDQDALRKLQPYFEGTASTHFFVQQNARTFSYQTWQECQSLAGFIETIQPNCIHFDTAKARALGLLPLLYRKYRKRVLITIHDPAPHSGEFNWRNVLVKKGFFPLTSRFLFYSRFSEDTFRKLYPSYKDRTAVLGMYPYSFYRCFKNNGGAGRRHILFFGRISPYKGVDVFLKAIPLVLSRFPGLSFVIAGAKSDSYQLSATDLAAAGGQLECRLRHIPNEELVQLVESALMVVCPYRDATQSGVLMTAFACDTGVVASKVGAFPEFIAEGENGALVPENDPGALANAIIEALEKEAPATWTANLEKQRLENPWLAEKERLTALYKLVGKKND